MWRQYLVCALFVIVLALSTRVEFARLVRVVRRLRWPMTYHRIGRTGRVLVARDDDGLRSICYGVSPITGKRRMQSWR